MRIFELVWNRRQLATLLLYGTHGGRFEHLADALVDGSRVHTLARFEWGRGAGVYRPDLDVYLAAVMVGGAYERAARQMVRLAERPNVPRTVGTLERMLARAIGTEAYIRAVDSVTAPWM